MLDARLAARSPSIPHGESDIAGSFDSTFVFETGKEQWAAQQMHSQDLVRLKNNSK
jgi:hypothetical protein